MLKIIRYVLLVIPWVLFNKIGAINYDYHHLNEKSNYKGFLDVQDTIKRTLKAFQCKLIVEGQEKLPLTSSYVLAPNHQSLIDCLIFIYLFKEPVTFLAKKELEKVPWIGKFIKVIRGKFLDRSNLKKEVKTMAEIRDSLKNDHLIWTIFAEGTRSKNKDYAPNEFKGGAFKCAMQSGVDIVPVAIWGTYKIMNTKIKHHAYKIFISFLKPLKRKDYENLTTQEVANIIKSKVEAKVNELRETDKALMTV